MCDHRFALDEEHVRHRCCQLCGEIQAQQYDGSWQPVSETAADASAGSLIRRTRESRKWSREHLALKAGVGVQTIVRMEAGSKGTTLGNLEAVSAVLGLGLRFEDSAREPVKLPLHPLDLESDMVDAVVRAAVTAACEELDVLFPDTKPEANGICSNFAGLLGDHLKAMLAGTPHARIVHRVSLPVLGYTEASFDGPRSLPEGADGWLVQVIDQNQFLEPSNSYRNMGSPFRRLESITDLYSSRDAAIRCAKRAITELGQPDGLLTIIPGRWAGVSNVMPWEDSPAS